MIHLNLIYYIELVCNGLYYSQISSNKYGYYADNIVNLIINDFNGNKEIEEKLIKI